MNRTLMVVVLALLCAVVWAQGEPVQTQTVTVPVRSYVPARTLTAAETAFLQTVPTDGGLREAVRQMLQAGVCHVPTSGKYQPGDSVRYWSMYQVWTAPYRAEIPAPQPAQVIEKPVVVEKPVIQTVPVPQVQLVTVPAPVVPARQFIQPAGVSAVYTPAATIAAGATVAGDWHDRVTATLIYRPQPRPPAPPGGTCPPGTAPTPPAPPAAGGTTPTPPPDQPVPPPPPGVNGQPWDPGPDAPTVADPVIENP